MSQWKKVGVIGCGLMGSGIAEVAARAGYETIVREPTNDLLEKGVQRIRGSLGKAVEKGKLPAADRDATLARLKPATDLGALADCDVVVEAIVENEGAKRELFSQLDKIVKKGALFGSNTSSISITAMAAATARPERFCGIHFMNPVPVMKLVELVRGLRTGDETLAEARAFCESLGKTTITAKDTPGFVINMLLVPYLLEAVRMVEAGVASKEDIDKGMTLGCNMPMGPITLLDFVGLDTTLFIADVLFDELRDPRYGAPVLLRRMVAAGQNGKKSGQGFYKY